MLIQGMRFLVPALLIVFVGGGSVLQAQTCSQLVGDVWGLPIAAQTEVVEGRSLGRSSSILAFGRSLGTVTWTLDPSTDSRSLHIDTERSAEGIVWIPVDDEAERTRAGVVASQAATATFFDLAFTAVAVGPKVILTAAHNLNPKEETEQGFRLPGMPSNDGYCDVHPAYPGDKSADLALCLMNENLDLQRYEKVNLDPQVEGDTEDLFLSGFGCYGEPLEARNGAFQARDGTLSFKTASIGKRPSENGNRYLQAKWCLCKGDSGGPGFNTKDPETRVILGVNSQKGCGVDGFDCAMLTSTAASAEWIKAWAAGKAPDQKSGKGQKNEIYGVNDSCPD